MSRGSEIKVRPGERRDVPGLVRLLEAYMREVFASPWHGTAEALTRDGFGQEFETQVATSDADEVVGFATWMKSYDVIAAPAASFWTCSSCPSIVGGPSRPH